MIPADFAVQVYLALGVTDMRKSIDGLALLVSEQLGLNPLGDGLELEQQRAHKKLEYSQIF